MIDSAFAPGDADAARVGGICRALDGIPLAIELAAAHSGHDPDVQAIARLAWEIGRGADARGPLERPLQLARGQGAQLLELPAVMRLARLAGREGRTPEALQMLRTVHARFTEGFSSPDLLRAHALLSRWSAPQQPAGAGPAAAGRGDGAREPVTVRPDIAPRAAAD